MGRVFLDFLWIEGRSPLLCCVWIHMNIVHANGNWVVDVFGFTDLLLYEKADLPMKCRFWHSPKWKEMHEKTTHHI